VGQVRAAVHRRPRGEVVQRLASAFEHEEAPDENDRPEDLADDVEGAHAGQEAGHGDDQGRALDCVVTEQPSDPRAAAARVGDPRAE
jgi:hypothetical protein